MTGNDLAASLPQDNFGDYQLGIYARGMLGGERPSITTNLARLDEAAREVLSPEALGYITSSAGSGMTARANRAAFDQWSIVPQMLRSAQVRDHTCEILGTQMRAPVLLAPIGVQTLAHPEGELASAAAAAAVGLTYVHSTQASHTMEQVAEANGPGSRWYQLYWPRDQSVCRSFLDRARQSGYTTLVLTLDTTTLGWRPWDLDAGYLPFLANIGIANYLHDPAFLSGLGQSVEDDPVAAAMHFAQMYSNPGLSWSDLPFLRRHWDGPIVLKGIQSVPDAQLALKHGMDGIVVSNHGGRQIDGAIASLTALERIVADLNGRLTVLFDSGLRSGSDVVKALALGADAVQIGRPYLFGLALGGQRGVEHVLRSLLAEMDITIALAGHRSQRELSRADLTR